MRIEITAANENKAKRLPQYVAGLIATMGGFVMGTVLAWTSPTSATLAPQYGLTITDLEHSFIGGMANVGAMMGAAGGGVCSAHIGHQRGLVAIVVPSLIGWGLIICAQNVAMIIAGRIMLGIVMGLLTVLCPLYTSEISEDAIRGRLGTYFQMQVTIGIFFDYVVGSSLSSVMVFSAICGVIPVVLAVSMAFMPETPQFYLMKKREAAARRSLQFYRGDRYDIDDEIAAMKATIEKVKEEKLSYREAFTTKSAKRGLIIGLGVMLFQQLSGKNSVIFYNADIFMAAGSTLPASTSSMIAGGVQVMATSFSTVVVDRLGRKPLLFTSAAIMSVSSAVLGVYFYLKRTGSDVSSLCWLPVCSVALFLIMFSIGFGPISWMLLGEIFPPAIRAPATSICCISSWLWSFVVTSTFHSLSTSIGLDFTFWSFATISMIGALFVLFYIPETKGKSLEDIQRRLRNSLQL